MTNQDLVTLAKAGFEENFIIAIVHSSQKRFDTSVEGLADLAQQGISQRLIQAIMTPAEPVAPAASPTGAAPPVATVHSTSTNLSPQLREYIVAVSPINMAVSGNVPYYELKSSFWGFRRKEVGVTGVYRPGAKIGAHMPASNFYTQYPRYSLPVGGYQTVQQHQLSPVLSHYVLPR